MDKFMSLRGMDNLSNLGNLEVPDNLLRPSRDGFDILEKLDNAADKKLRDKLASLGYKPDEKGIYTAQGVKFSTTTNWLFDGKFLNLHIEESPQYGFNLSISCDTVEECLNHLHDVRKFLDIVKTSKEIIHIRDLMKELCMDKSIQTRCDNAFTQQPWMVDQSLNIPDNFIQHYLSSGLNFPIQFIYIDKVNYIKIRDNGWNPNLVVACGNDLNEYKFILIDPKGLIIPGQKPIVGNQNEFYHKMMNFDDYYKLIKFHNLMIYQK
jgi:hypothetical protein